MCNVEEVACNPPAPPSPDTINMENSAIFCVIDIVVDFNSYIKCLFAVNGFEFKDLIVEACFCFIKGCSKKIYLASFHLVFFLNTWIEISGFIVFEKGQEVSFPSKSWITSEGYLTVDALVMIPTQHQPFRLRSMR